MHFSRKAIVAAASAGAVLGAISMLILKVHGITHVPKSSTETIPELREARDALIDDYRKHGQLPANAAQALKARLRNFVDATGGESKARGLFEFATLERITGEFDKAIGTYEETSSLARKLQITDLTFDAEIGIARSYANGTTNHGAAALAFQRAVAAAGVTPTRKQRYAMADYISQLEEGWGDLDAALVNALHAVRLAENDSDRFYAQLNAASALQKFAESCDYHKLVDAKSSSDSDPWAGCRRAVAAAKSYYLEARKTAEQLHWSALVKQADEFLTGLDARLWLINRRASSEAAMSQAAVFSAQRLEDVLVNMDFSAGGSSLNDAGALTKLIDSVVPGSGQPSSRDLYLRGVQADMAHNPRIALDCYQRSVEMLQQERASMFELRQRGTVIENRVEHVRDLGLRLLANGATEPAFAAFESIRAHGLGTLAAAFAKPDVSGAHRQSLAELVQVDAEESALLRDLVQTTIAGVAHSKAAELSEQVEQIRNKRQHLLDQPQYVAAVTKVKETTAKPVSMTELAQLSHSTGVAVLMYWVTPVNVVVWNIAPALSEVKTVFLPEAAVVAKIARLRESVSSPGQSGLDTVAARELYTYLIAPFRKQWTRKQILVVPQGPLIDLPFEVLVDPQSGKYLVEEFAVSYAPSAIVARRALLAPPATVSPLTVLYDQNIDQITGEVAKLRATLHDGVEAVASNSVSPPAALQLFARARNLHVLLHGGFAEGDALLSGLTLNNLHLDPEADVLTAAALMAVDWRAVNLVVFSSCEGAMLSERISNELYGLAWAPLVGGVPRVILSRWRVQSQSNALWMEAFYRSLAVPGTSAAQASALAMRKLIGHGEYKHPFYWAAPQLFGG
jgi:CHAT domain-containing protein